MDTLTWRAMFLILLCFGVNARSEEVPLLDLRLMATDLVDELVFSWSNAPPYPAKTNLLLADISSPVGLDETFQIFVENRLYDLFRQNPALPVALSYCGACQRFLVRSNPQETKMMRAIDDPQVLAELAKANPEQKALSLQFEAVGQELVLRAQIFSLKPPQTLDWAKTFTTSQTSRRLLRDGTPLMSWEAAKAKQEAILSRQDPLEISTRMTIRQFNLSARDQQVPPFLFVEQSFEAVPGPKRALRAAFTLGFASIKDSFQGFSAGGHAAKLLFSNTPSLIYPDLYWFFGVHYLRLRGPAIAPFAVNQFDLLNKLDISKEPRASLTAYRLGLEAHVKFRLGMLLFLEYVPLLKKNDSFREEKFVGIPYHNFGLGMVIRW